MKITTESGFRCEINEDALNDWEMVEKLSEAQKTKNIVTLGECMKDMIGEDGYQAAKDYVRNDQGRVPISEMSNLFYEIMTATRDENQSKKK